MRNTPAYATRSAIRRHDKQVEDHCCGGCPDYLLRSILGMAYVYNLLPQKVVETRSVSGFQCILTNMVRKASCGGVVDVDLFCQVSVRQSVAYVVMNKYSRCCAD